MARRRKDIKKRRKVQEEQQVFIESDELEEDLVEEQEEMEETLDDDFIVQADSLRKKSEPEKVSPRPVRPTVRDDSKKDSEALPSGWFGKNKGTVGELFETEWILNLPIFR
jgi:hypothetical protein